MLIRWFTAYEQRQDEEVGYDKAAQRADKRVDALMPRIMNAPSVRRMATNPLLLTILALIHETVGRLPNRRVKLYEIATKTMIESWRAAQSDMPSRLKDELEEETILPIMAQLAYWLHETHPGGTATLEEWRERLVEAIIDEHFDEKDAREIANRFLYHARHETGLLT